MQKSNFEIWRDEADIPQKQKDGSWVDLETGIPFDPKFNYGQQTQRSTVETNKYAAEIKAARADAKKLGLVKITGSTKQKQWAEQIRIERMKAIPDVELSNFAGKKLFAAAKFWIETRKLEVDEITKTIKQVRDLNNKAWDLTDKYNSLFPDDVAVNSMVAITHEQSQIVNEIYKINALIKSITNPESSYSR
jgi:hypothetical protein